MPRFAANLSMMFNELPFLERFAAARQAGFEGLEFLFPYDFPAPELRSRPLVGVRLLYAFHRGETAWDGGRIYDARSGRTYQARISRSTEGALSVTGCLGPFCQSQTWTQVK